MTRASEVGKETYRKIPAVLIRRTENAILVEIGAQLDRVWVPRSLLRMDTDLLVESLPQMAEFEMHLAEWKADQFGL